MRIYFTNDLHGSEGALKWLEKRAFSAIESGEALFFDSGDALLGSNTVFRRHEPNLAYMSRLGCTAMAMGNREFSYLRRVLDLRSDERSFPLICSNLCDVKLEGRLGAAEYVNKICKSSGEAPTAKTGDGLSPRWTGWLRLPLPHRGGKINLIVLGAVPVQYPHNSFWENLFKFRFYSAEESLVPLADYLLGQSRNQPSRLIVLSHLGLDRDIELAAKLPGGTWILGGHTHTVLCEPKRIGDVFITQTGAHSQYVGELDYNLDDPCSSRCRLHKC
ncbi:metallophosphoesterase [bacterium]|nr:metallophosphoesterase [bacterium]